jgi:PAS domain S-box-containing protein
MHRSNPLSAQRRERRHSRRRRSDIAPAQILDNIYDAVIATDSRLLITAWNKGAENMYGWRADEAIGHNFWDLVPIDLTEDQFAHVLASLGERRPIRVSAVTYRKDGTPVYVEGISIAIRADDDPSRITGYVNIRRDVTERESAEASLRRSKGYLAEGQRLSHTGSWAWNLRTGEVYWSDEHYRICGLDPAGPPPVYPALGWVHPDVRAQIRALLDRAVHERTDSELDFRVMHPDGSIRYVHSLAHPVLNEAGELEELVGTSLDITERHEGEEARMALLRRIVAAHEEERARLSRELHDDLGQQLTGLKLTVAALQEQTDRYPHLSGPLATLESIVKQLDSDVDLIAWQLRPAALDDLGLAAALTTYVQGWSSHYHVPADVQVAGTDTARLSSEAEIALYRIMQEGLHNIAKHAHAHHASVVLQQSADQVSLVIEDDGRGFDSNRLWTAADKRIGLVGMRERAALLGGTVDIESAPAQGTTVIVRIPAAAPPPSNSATAP